MNKSVLLVLIALAFLRQSQAAFPSPCLARATYVCGDVGATCGVVTTNNNTGSATYTSCKQGTFCFGASALATSGTCTTNLALGASCTDALARNVQNLGDSVDDVCGPNAVCNAGICTGITYNVTVGGACGGANQCKSTLSCSVGVCTQLPSAGEACTLICSGANDCVNFKCVAWGSVAVGGACSQLLGFACVGGAFCNSKSVCQASFTSSKQPCTVDADCTQNTEEICACNSDGSNSTVCLAPEVPTSSQLSTLASYSNCVATNCASTDCSACQSEICSYNSLGTAASNEPTCASHFKELCNSAVSVAVSLFMVVVGVFLAL